MTSSIRAFSSLVLAWQGCERERKVPGPPWHLITRQVKRVSDGERLTSPASRPSGPKHLNPVRGSLQAVLEHLSSSGKDREFEWCSVSGFLTSQLELIERSLSHLCVHYSDARVIIKPPHFAAVASRRNATLPFPSIFAIVFCNCCLASVLLSRKCVVYKLIWIQ